MADNCNIENLKVLLTQVDVMSGGSVEPDRSITSRLSPKDAYTHELLVGRRETGRLDKPKVDPRQEIEKAGIPRKYDPNKLDKGKNLIRAVADLNNYQNPSAVTGKLFYNQVVSDARQARIDGKSPFEVNKILAEKAKATLKEITDIVKSGGDVEAQLKGRYRFGKDQLYYAVDWLDWAANDYGHEKNTIVGQASSNLSRAMSRMNFTWAIGAAGDVSRIIAPYVHKPGVLAKGLSDTFVMNGGPIGAFRQLDKYKKLGLYETGNMERKPLGNSEPFSWGVTLGKNLAFNLDRADGGNGFDGVAEHAFDYESFDQAPIYRNPTEAKGVFGLARFPIAEAIWHINTTKRALMGDAKAITTLAVYNLAKTMVFGAKSVIWGPVWAAMPEENNDVPVWSKNWWNEVNDTLPISNLLGKGVSSAANATGANIKVDLSTFAQPMSLSLGGRVSALSDVWNNSAQASTDFLADVASGKLDEAALNAASVGLSVANVFYPSPSGGPLAQGAYNLFNNTTTGKIIRKFEKSLEEEYTPDQRTRAFYKGLLGDSRVKKGDRAEASKSKSGSSSFGSFGSF